MIDWPSCNQSLVRLGQVLLDFDVLDGWDHELSQMNEGKVGEPYDYPDSFMQTSRLHESIYPSTIQTERGQILILVIWLNCTYDTICNCNVDSYLFFLLLLLCTRIHLLHRDHVNSTSVRHLVLHPMTNYGERRNSQQQSCRSRLSFLYHCPNFVEEWL